jgi:hypothetical protein
MQSFGWAGPGSGPTGEKSAVQICTEFLLLCTSHKVSGVTDTEKYVIHNKVTERATFLRNLKSALFWSCPDLTIKERTAAALA